MVCGICKRRCKKSLSQVLCDVCAEAIMRLRRAQAMTDSDSKPHPSLLEQMEENRRTLNKAKNNNLYGTV
jgi:hypothetical protein